MISGAALKGTQEYTRISYIHSLQGRSKWALSAALALEQPSSWLQFICVEAAWHSQEHTPNMQDLLGKKKNTGFTVSEAQGFRLWFSGKKYRWHW